MNGISMINFQSHRPFMFKVFYVGQSWTFFSIDPLVAVVVVVPIERQKFARIS